MGEMMNFNPPSLVLNGREDMGKQLKRLEQYLFSMTEQLRFTLANLEPEANFSDTALKQWASATGAGGGSTGGGTAPADGVSTLFSRFGTTANLAAWKLKTDGERVDKFLTGDLTPIRYLTIENGVIRFVRAVTDGTKTVQLADGEQLFWYKNANSRAIVTENTGFPVTVYQYTETVAAQIGWDGDTVRGSGVDWNAPVTPPLT